MPADFFMASRDYRGWESTRGCRVVRHLAGPRANGYWLVEVSPPVPPSVAGTHDEVAQLVLAERHAGDNLSALADKSVAVYVCIPVNEAAIGLGVIGEDDVRLVAWADVARDPALLDR